MNDFVDKLEKNDSFKKRTAIITFDDGFYSMYSIMLPISRRFHIPVTLFVYLDRIRSRGDKILTWKKLRELDASGIDIQSHTITHVDLTKITADKMGQKRLYDEIYMSKRVLELYLGKRVEYFAFPYGRYNVQLVELAKMAGYKRVFSTEFGSNLITRNNFCLRRHHIKSGYNYKDFFKILDEDN
jgi:peptidoglycan/xylan/chitin deacetylase (PgdA/CDA1 family)